MDYKTDRSVAVFIMAVAVVTGYGSLLAMLVFLYFAPPTIVDLGLDNSSVLAFDSILSLAFFVQHSGMVRKRFRRFVSTWLSARYDRAFYTIVSGTVLLAVLVLWQKSRYIVITVDGPARWLMRAGFISTVLLFYWGTRSLHDFDTLGLRPIARYLRGRAAPAPVPFTVSGPYRWVRHPLYLFTIIMIWTCPDVSADRLLFNVLWTIWILFGIVLEERDLVAEFGEPYRVYQRRVPMLVPWRGPDTQ